MMNNRSCSDLSVRRISNKKYNTISGGSFDEKDEEKADEKIN